MTKKIKPVAGVQALSAQQLIDEERACFEANRARLENEISILERDNDEYDAGQSAVETREEIRYLNDEIRFLEQKYYQRIMQIKSQQR